MRLRTLAALALVTALFASPLAAFACGFECGPAPAAATKLEPVEQTPAEGSCHRKVHEATASAFTISAAPHDCSTHSPIVPRLTNPGAASFVTKAATAAVLLPGSRTAAHAIVLSAPMPATHDLAPPGRTPGSIAPLRI